MPTESREHEDITKLLHDAFVRICQLAVADCGVSAAELTLHLTIQLNTRVPQVLSSTLVETIRSPLANESHHAEHGVGVCETLNKSESIDKNNSDEKESFARSHSFDSSVDVEDVDSEDFNGNVTVGLASYPIGVKDADSLILSENRHGEVPLEELLADVEKSDSCNKYESESPMVLLGSGENMREACKMYGSRCTSLSNLGYSQDGLVPVSDAVIISTLNSYKSDVLTPCTSAHCSEDIVYDSDGQCSVESTPSFLQHCHFVEQDIPRSNSACISAESAFHGLGELVEKARSVDKVSGNDGAEIEVDGSSISRHSFPGDKSADKSVAGHASYEEELVVDESSSSPDTRSCHLVTSDSSRTNLCSPLYTETAATFVKDVSLTKPYDASHLLPAVCPTVQSPDGLACSYSQQPTVLSIGPNSYRLITINTDETGHDTRVTDIQKILSSVSTNVSAAVRDANRGKTFHSFVFSL